MRLVASVVAVLCLAMGSVAADVATGIAEDSSKQEVQVAEKASGSLPLDNRDKFLFGSYATATYTQVVASTSTVFFSCLSGTAAQSVCSGRQGRGRRSKKMKKPDLALDNEQSSIGIESSQGDDLAGNDASLTSPNDKNKFAFTIWTTSRTTTSVTVFFTDTNTTIRLSYYCAAAGIDFPQFNCVTG